MKFKSKNINLSAIKISEQFKDTKPSPDKINTCYSAYINHGMFDRSIIVDRSNVLLDGYVAYLVARMLGIESVRVVLASEAKEPKAKQQNTLQDKPTVREVKRLAKVGEWVKVVNAHNSLGNYKNGDILHIVKADAAYLSHSEEWAFYDNKRRHYLTADEYVVRENYVPEKQEDVSIDWDAFKNGKLSVNCKNVQEVRMFMRECEAHGISMNGGHAATSHCTTRENDDHWRNREYSSGVAFVCDRGFAKLGFCHVGYYKEIPSIEFKGEN